MSGDLNRRKFLKSLMAAAAAGPVLSNFDLVRAIGTEGATTTITILQTNDTHSQLEPFPPGTRNAGMGGVARRATYVKRVKQENPNTLLVDSGDFFQGTPYFNFYQGEVEVKAMSAIGYDVVNLGNHDFDDGTEGLVRALKYANFQVVSANYNCDASLLKGIVKPYVVRTLSGIRVGVFGMGIDFNGLVLASKHEGVIYRDPIESAIEVVAKLRGEEKVDLIVCVSHLGYKYDNEPDKISDVLLAKAVPEIDFIGSGHIHGIFMKEPDVIKHPNGRQTLIYQVGFGGINVARVDFTFSDKKLVGWRSDKIELTT